VSGAGGESLAGGLMVCGTTSDAGKSTLVAGLCRLLARRGVRVAPYKAQNMALNSAVTAGGHEIGRAQAAQALAAGIEAEVAMNPVLLKPSSDRSSQVVVMGKPWASLDAAGYQDAKRDLWPVVTEQLRSLRERFDVVLCEGAGSPAEINLLDGDLVNLRLAHHAGLPAILVGDIDRGGVFAALYGTVGLLPDDLRQLVRAFVVNKFRGDPAVLGRAPSELERRTGVPTVGVVPWLEGIGIDAEDSLALRSVWPGEPAAGSLDVAVVSLPRVSNVTDVDALRVEPDVAVRLVASAASLGRPDLVVLPGTKSTVADLAWLRRTGLAGAVAGLAAPGGPTTVLGVCGGFQMLGETIDDPVESREPCSVTGLGLLPVRTRFAADKLTRRVRGAALGRRFDGYEIHHGRTEPVDPWVALDSGPGWDGSRRADGGVWGTSVHGLFESDGVRSAFLSGVADRAGKAWMPSGVSFANARQARFDAIADALEVHLDVEFVTALIASAGSRAVA
jgi:adenosylcobyric acid synthase